MADEISMHEALGGDEFFVELVRRFYRGVAADPLLRPLYPDDLEESQRTLRLFLIQYWGGGTAYSDERGHPRLRMRHAPFVIGGPERDAWMRHMTVAVDELAAERAVSAELRTRLIEYFQMAADHMINTA